MSEEVKVITAVRELVYPFCRALDLSSEECSELSDEVCDLAKGMVEKLIIIIWWRAVSMKFRKTKALESLMDYLRGLVELRY
jgi:hypothetical protein